MTSQVAVIAGASSGIGRAIARLLNEQGWSVALLARDESKLRASQNQLPEPDRSAVVAIDAADPDMASQAIQACTERFGHVDTLINSVGANVPERALHQLDLHGWNSMVAANLTPGFVLTQAILPWFRKQGSGHIIHVSSVGAKSADLSGAAYQASKAGVAALARATMLEESPHGVRVSVIFPGMTNTPLLYQRPQPPTTSDLERALRPEDVAVACSFIANLPPTANVPELIIEPSPARPTGDHPR